VKTGRGYVNAYLVEVRSIAGLSGSPVFLNVPHFRMKDGQMQTLTNPIYQPIGILVGYHIIESREDQITVPRDQNFVPAATEFVGMPELNTGFGVVIPIERLIDILEKDDEKARRKSAAATHFANAGYVQTVR
jgi:hypothetical protein